MKRLIEQGFKKTFSWREYYRYFGLLPFPPQGVTTVGEWIHIFDFPPVTSLPSFGMALEVHLLATPKAGLLFHMSDKHDAHT